MEAAMTCLFTLGCINLAARFRNVASTEKRIAPTWRLD